MATDTMLEEGAQQREFLGNPVNEYRLRIFQNSLNLLAHILIGIVVGAALLYAFNNGLPIGGTPKHIVLCVLGYQLLMGQAILSLAPHNSWSANLKLVDKRRAHWVLQIVGSTLAIAGTFVKIIDKKNQGQEHFTSLHGRFALVALVFTSVCLFNGLASLWAFELRRFIPQKLSKLTHICFGIMGFAAANITLGFGMEKAGFRGFAGDGNSYTLIGFVSCFTFIIIITPFVNFISKVKSK